MIFCFCELLQYIPHLIPVVGNASVAIEFTESGIKIYSSFLHDANAFEFIVCTPLCITTDLSEMQLANILSGMEVIEDGKTILSNLGHDRKQ